MGRYVYAIVIAGFVLVVGLAMFPGIKAMFGFNSTAGFSDMLKGGYTFLPYFLVIIIGYAVYKAARGSR